MPDPIVFIDLEVNPETNAVLDYGAADMEGNVLHTRSAEAFRLFIQPYPFIGGHNILAHDLQHMQKPAHAAAVDTLPLSALLFPERQSHALPKDEKLSEEEWNNPQNDALKAKALFLEELAAFEALDPELREIYGELLRCEAEFAGFLRYAGQLREYASPAQEDGGRGRGIFSRLSAMFSHAEQTPVQEAPGSGGTEALAARIRAFFSGRLCAQAPLGSLIAGRPAELALALAVIHAGESVPCLPQWVLMHRPGTADVLHLLRSLPCGECAYCRAQLDARKHLKKYFGYDGFRTFNGEDLQERAVNAAVRGSSILVIFPTGGGKSLTFQLPALMAGETGRSLTVVLSPLQSLMKDQVDNLEKKGITDAVTINGMLNPIERQNAVERVLNGSASLLYISPESLRSRTVEKLLLSRDTVRFVIDEAHCFSAWGQDFRPDYQYIGDFIRSLQEKKGRDCKIPVSCFTATAKPKVISDIKLYFSRKLGLDLELFATDASRTNLRYEVLYRESDGEKYLALRNLIEEKNCPAIVYVSRTARTRELADRLTRDGFPALPFNGKRMNSVEKQENQNAFMRGEVNTIVATSAFGMGVDKSDVGLVVHYDISDSLENYVQESGRAGRDQSLSAECYVLFNDNDLDKHFLLLNQTRLSISEIQQVWRAVKSLTRTHPRICCSALEIAREAGWDDLQDSSDIETKVKTALQALENAGYIRRGHNMPRVYADGILAHTMAEAAAKIDAFAGLDGDGKKTARRIIAALISARSRSKAGNADAESRIDYLADRLGLTRQTVLHLVQVMRDNRLLADSMDLTAYFPRPSTRRAVLGLLRLLSRTEQFLLAEISPEGGWINLKELNQKAQDAGIKNCSVRHIETILRFWQTCSHVRAVRSGSRNTVSLEFLTPLEAMREKCRRTAACAAEIAGVLFDKAEAQERGPEQDGRAAGLEAEFSVLELQQGWNSTHLEQISSGDVEDALLYLVKMQAVQMEGGFLVLYSAMELQRLILDNHIRYKVSDYEDLAEYYRQRVQQIHIVGEYANLMVRDYNAALRFVNDYFHLDYKEFLRRYFAGEKAARLARGMTQDRYEKLFAALSPAQKAIIGDSASRCIVVAAGPGSGKTKVLVHKLASLLQLEDVRHEQLLMLTFSRAAALEFKLRLKELIGNAACFVEIKTFHSYCFDLLGKVGSLEESENAVRDAAALIRSGGTEPGRIAKTVLVIDEAQDMDVHEFSLVEALMERNEDMRVIAVGDDDQNIYAFRGSSPEHLKTLIRSYGAKLYDLCENFRSARSITSAANAFAASITDRLKSQPIRPVRSAEGEALLIRHAFPSMAAALAADLEKTRTDGTCGVLTQTNDEALLILGILQRRGIAAKLVQENDGFDTGNLAELRYFLKKLRESAASFITQEKWEEAEEALASRYAASAALPLARDILGAFRRTHEKLYRSDLEMFLHESQLSDFITAGKGEVAVSTIHKAKGREFDSVYMLLDPVRAQTDEDRRILYVGMTRAKDLLHIHYRGSLPALENAPGVRTAADATRLPEPEETVLQLGLRDVFLGFFKDQERQDVLKRLVSGTPLLCSGSSLGVRRGGGVYPLVRFSKRFREKLERLKQYEVHAASVRFLLAWKDLEEQKEYAVLLPDLVLKKKAAGR